MKQKGFIYGGILAVIILLLMAGNLFLGAVSIPASAVCDDGGLTYVATSAGIQICDYNGRSAAILELPEGERPLSLAFGGENMSELYVLGDRGNIFGLADKFIEDALRDCKVIPDDGPQYVVNFTHDFIYTAGTPYIRVEIEEVDQTG